MNLHNLIKTPGSKRNRTRVGRGDGSGLGKTCGRGHKGQLARKGHKNKLGFEGGQMRLIRRIPKRGFKHNTDAAFPVNVGDLVKFDAGSIVTIEVMRRSGIVHGPASWVKILGTGELDRKLIVHGHAFSAQARAKIEQKGGTCEVLKR